MGSPSPVLDSAEGLDQRIEAHLQRLSERIGRSYSTDVMEVVESLSTLLYSYKTRDEMLERLLESETGKIAHDQGQSKRTLQKVRQEEDCAELRRAHERSHELLERAVHLIVLIHRQLARSNDDRSNYAAEDCGYCLGAGAANGFACTPCHGGGRVYVHQPSLKCPRCKGNGRSDEQARALYESDSCLVCGGSGWVMAVESVTKGYA